MARYIDADALITDIQETICAKCNMHDGIKCKSCGIDDTLDSLENAPTAFLFSVATIMPCTCNG